MATNFLLSGIEIRYVALELKNFLSFKQASVDFDDFTALIGANASGKSNFVTAIKLLREIPLHGLPTAIARRGGFDQLRHRSAGRPNDPSLSLTFTLGEAPPSTYEIAFASVRGKRYAVKREHAEIFWGEERHTFSSDGALVRTTSSVDEPSLAAPIPPGQSALTIGGSFAAFVLFSVLQSMQTVEINPARLRDIQEPSSVRDFEPDGSNAASIYEALDSKSRAILTEQLSTIVPTIERIDVEALTDRQTLVFAQRTASGRREFTARQMSDGTLRTFGILLAAFQNQRPSMLVVEEPETAIHLGAMRTLIQLLQSQTAQMQIVITTHSAEMVDYLEVDSLRVVTADGDSSHISRVAQHTVGIVREGLVTPGELLRMNALDPERPS